MTRSARFLGSAAMLLMFPVLGRAQNAELSGRVKDPSDATIPNASVAVTNEGTGIRRTTSSNKDGLYTVPSLPPGSYKISVSAQGFQTVTRTGVKLEVEQRASLDFTLPVGATTEVVTVEGGTPLVNTTDASVSTVVDRQFVQNIPLNGRSFQTLLMLTPGAVLTPSSYGSLGQFSVNGQRTDANYFSIDGVSANVGVGAGSGLTQTAAGSVPAFSTLGGTNSLVSVDAMQEFRVQTSSFAPEFGRTPGGQVSIATRSGTNQFHGVLFEYLRNDALDANNWFADRNSQSKPQERQNDFGGVIGGPLLKNRSFFFFSYEGLRLRQPQTLITVVPSTAARQAAPAGVQALLNAFPLPLPSLPALTNGRAQFASSFSNPSTLDAYSLRLDQVITPKMLLFGRYSYSPSQADQRGGSVLSSVQSVSVTSHMLTLGLTAAISPMLSNELRTNYSNVRGGTTIRLDNFGGATPLPDRAMFPAGFSSANAGFQLLVIGAGASTSGTAILSAGEFSNNEQRQINLIDNLSIVKATHQIKVGVDYRWLSPISGLPPYQGILLFNGVAGPSGVSGPSGSVVSGTALRATIRAFRETTLLVHNLSLYAQDNWKIGKRITLTYGLRWDVNPALTGKNSSNDPSTVQGLDNPATLALAPAGSPLYDTTYGNIAPRFGIAYQLRQKQGWESVFRGGVGVFYDLGTGDLGQLTFGFPFNAAKNVSNVAIPLTPQQAAPPALTQTPIALIYVSDPRLKLPRTYQWNTAFEQSLGTSQVVSLTYVGIIGRDLLRANTLLNPNTTFSQVTAWRNTATSDYHALQVKYQRRLSHGLQALASYTWSHAIDIGSNDTVAGSTPGSPLTDRGDADFDIRHSVTGALTYDVPFPSAPKIARAVFGNWALDSFFVARSAFPVDITAATGTAGGTIFNARPNIVAGVPFYLFDPQFPGGKAFNQAAFVAAASGQQGNLARNVLRGFGVWQEDFAVRRQFQVSDRIGVQFRTELFNVFNHPQFADPIASLTSGLFGQSTQILASSLGSGGTNGGLTPLYQIGSPRSVQFALKLQF